MTWPCLGMTSNKSVLSYFLLRDDTHSLSNVIDDNRAVGVPVVHRRQGLVSFLPGGIPYFEFHRRILIKRDGLCKESSADG